MATSSIGSIISKSLKRILTTPPNTWIQQWQDRHIKTRGGYLKRKARFSENELIIAGMEVMQVWERPLMKALAQEAARSKGHVLEVGFGMGISATYLVEAGCASYTVIEPHPEVLAFFDKWARQQSINVEAKKGFWEDVIDQLGMFDGILFDTYPVTWSEEDEKLYVPFIAKASEHLKPGGVFTFFTGYENALPDHHMELLAKHFSDMRFYSVDGLQPPSDCQYYSASSMLVPVCIK